MPAQCFENAFEQPIGAIDPPRNVKDRDGNGKSETEEYPANVAHSDLTLAIVCSRDDVQ